MTSTPRQGRTPWSWLDNRKLRILGALRRFLRDVCFCIRVNGIYSCDTNVPVASAVGDGLRSVVLYAWPLSSSATYFGHSFSWVSVGIGQQTE